ncbi:PaaI family thioesterase [Streptococcus cameli]
MNKNYLHSITVFENYKVEAIEDGRVIISTKVVDSSLNYYGNAHGGYLFTMCDQIAGLVTLSLKTAAVTMQSSMNYMRAARLGDRLSVEGICVHNGKSTNIVEVTITNQDDEAVAKGVFTMYVTGKHDGIPRDMQTKK